MKTAEKKQLKIIAEPGKQEVFIIREFDASREFLFEAYTDPALLVQWLGPHNLVMTIDRYDARSGGSYRYIHTNEKGQAYGFHGSFHEVLPPERIIQTFEFEGLPVKGHASLDTIKFDTLPGNRTRLTIHSVFMSVADRDGMMASGMERGVTEGYERLDELWIASNK